MKGILFTILLFYTLTSSFAQIDYFKNREFTKADTLRGAVGPERAVYDVTFYDLHLKIEPEKKFLSGYVDIHFHAVRSFKTLQVDLFDNMEILKIEHRGKEMRYDRFHHAVFVDLLPGYNQGENGWFRIYYQGHPLEARNAPWDGGFVWKKDALNRPWVGVACEGIGASLWWPNKDHPSDEPDSMGIHISVLEGLTCVSNGQFRGKREKPGGFTEWNWFVSYPINNYNVTVNIAKYAHFQDTYVAPDGDSLACNYYVLPENLEKAKKQFQQVHGMMDCYYNYFGKYPFWRDGYAMVETPYLGMEHQSAIAYGNQYRRGYLGSMVPPDQDWDYIIIHESGHEWWGNSISCRDFAEMWIHESFTTYMEALYVECTYGYQKALDYLAMQRLFIRNLEPLIGPKHVNWDQWQTSDHYYKGAWILHTMRSALNQDALWFDLLKSFYQQHALGHITSEDFFLYFKQRTGKDWTGVFEQYFHHPHLPVLEYQLVPTRKGLKIQYRWKSDATNFNLPILVGKKEAYQVLKPTNQWQTTILKNLSREEFEIAPDRFLIKTQLKSP